MTGISGIAGFATTTSGELNLQDVDILSMKVPLDYLAGCCYQSLYADWVYGANSVDVECLAGWTSINSIVLLYYPKNSTSFHYGCWNCGTNPDLAFGSVNSDSPLPDRRVLENFARSLHRPLLITS